jgi:hypothetical protein
MANKLEVVADFDGDGIAVIGSSQGPKDGSFILTDDLGHVACLGLASANNAFMSGLEPGDIVLLNLGNGKIYLGTGTNSSFPTMAVAIGVVDIGNSNQPANLSVNGDLNVSGFFTGGRTSIEGNVGIGTDTPALNKDVINPPGVGPTIYGAAKLHIVGNNDMAGTIRLDPDPGKGANESLVHWDTTGDWYIRSAANNGKVVIQDQAAEGFVGIGTANPTAKLEVNGVLKVSGDVVLTEGADCAEEFDVADAEKIEPGTVLIINDSGSLEEGHQSYDKRVAGVVSGAGGFKPAITLDKQSSQSNRKSIALIGKVFCKVDARYSSIEVGDLLTTSPTIGHAMKAIDPLKAFGAVIGKALRPLREGQGLIPILVALQ